MLCPDNGRGCEIITRLESAFAACELTAGIWTSGKHFPFAFGNAAQMEVRDDEEDLRKENAFASKVEEERGNGRGGDVTLLPGSDDLLRQCDPCLSRLVSNRFMLFCVSQKPRRLYLGSKLRRVSTQRSGRLNGSGKLVSATLKAEEVQ